MLCCGAVCEGGAREGRMQLACWALVPLSNSPSCETGSFSHRCNPCCSPQSALSLSFPFSHPRPLGLLPCHGFFGRPFASLPPTGLVGLVDCFFNSLMVGVPCSLIFWHFWWFIVFRLVVILLLVVRGERFLPMPPSWLDCFTTENF